MKIFVVEDDAYKREEITEYLDKNNIEYEVGEYVNPALRYIVANKEKICGIILDLGLQRAPGINDFNLYGGLDIVNELNRKKIDIPILINSSTEVDMLEVYPSVFGQKFELNDYEVLDNFISFLRQSEEQ